MHYFILQEPITIELGTSHRYQQSGSSQILVECKDTFQYVPFLKNLERLLSNPEIYAEVCDAKGS